MANAWSQIDGYYIKEQEILKIVNTLFVGKFTKVAAIKNDSIYIQDDSHPDEYLIYPLADAKNDKLVTL